MHRRLFQTVEGKLGNPGKRGNTANSQLKPTYATVDQNSENISKTENIVLH